MIIRSRLARYMGYAVLAAAFSTVPLGRANAEPAHGIAMHGAPAYKADFTHFSYVNPDAPAGGDFRQASLGTFDSLNPFIVRGNPVVLLRVTNLVFERLMARSRDEPFSLYGLLAESIETPPDRSWVAFTLRPEARFSDGAPVTVDDVIFSLETLRDEGRPNYGAFYNKVEKIERVGERTVRFVFGEDGDRELPLIIGLMPILPKHIYEGERFTTADLQAPVGSGPYLFESVDAGQRLVLRRNPDYWGWNVPANRGHYNFETLSLEYFRDNNTLFQAFTKGIYDIRIEGDPLRWATGYDFPAVKNGEVTLETFETGIPKQVSGLVFNTRRPIFEDIRVREAFLHLFNGAWINRNLYQDRLARTKSYFPGSELSSFGRAADETENELLAPFMDGIPAAIMDGTADIPDGDLRGRNREGLRNALSLFEEAGYEARDGTLVNAETGEPFAFEILVRSRDQERLALSFGNALERAGIKVQIRQVDATQYQQRLQTYDFDMIENTWYPSLSPGNEQSFYWGSAAARTEGTRNYMGAEDPAIDAMIDALLKAEDRTTFVSAVRALDRVLRSGVYMIPLFHAPEQWIAHRSTLENPGTTLYGAITETWWSSAE